MIFWILLVIVFVVAVVATLMDGDFDVFLGVSIVGLGFLAVYSVVSCIPYNYHTVEKHDLTAVKSIKDTDGDTLYMVTYDGKERAVDVYDIQLGEKSTLRKECGYSRRILVPWRVADCNNYLVIKQ